VLRRLACLIAALTLLAAPACSDDDTDDAADTTTSSVKASETSLKMKDFSFDPEVVDIPSTGGSLRLVNEGTAAHTFTVDSLDIDQEVAAGSQVEVLVKAPDGEVPYYCRFHRSQGMEGTLRAKA
jgi:plastocyanin